MSEIEKYPVVYVDNLTFDESMLYLKFLQYKINDIHYPKQWDETTETHFKDVFIVYLIISAIVLSPVIFFGWMAYFISIGVFLGLLHICHKKFHFWFMYVIIKYANKRGWNDNFAYSEYYPDYIFRYDRNKERTIYNDQWEVVYEIDGDYFVQISSEIEVGFVTVIPKRHIQIFIEKYPELMGLVNKLESEAIKKKWPLFG